MTLLANLSNQGTGNTGVTFNGVEIFNLNITQMNAVISAYNAANSTNYPIWDSVEDNFEKLIHFIHVYCAVQNSALGNDTFNLKIVSASGGSQLYGIRNSLNSKQISIAFPFTSDSNVLGDSDEVG